MLGRYRIVRGRRPPDGPLPDGIRVDIRKHTRHVLAPSPEMVERYLAAVSDEAWKKFRLEYLVLLHERWDDDPTAFVELANRASDANVYLGCNCPTAKNPDVSRCHTVVALEFMRWWFAGLEVQMP